MNVDEVLRYFTVQVFVVNMDSYLGRTGHNYFLYEEEGRISILPWDYNLAFATYALGMPNPVRDATVLVNMPINTPASGEVMKNRPLYHNLMKNPDYYAQYHVYFDQLLKEYFESGYFEKFLEETKEMIAPYVEQDPQRFAAMRTSCWEPIRWRNFAGSGQRARGDSWREESLPRSGRRRKAEKILWMRLRFLFRIWGKLQI